MSNLQQSETPTPIYYNDIRIMTSKMLASFYECDSKKISYNFNYNKDRYQEGKHFFALEGVEKQNFINRLEIHDSSIKAKILHLWTEKGAFLHAKSLNTDKAWEAYEYLIDTYFKVKEIVKKQTPQSYPEALRQLADEVEQRQLLQAKIKEDAPKIEYHDKVLSSKGTITTTMIAKELGMTAQALNKILKDSKIQYKKGKNWILTKDYQGMGLTTTYSQVFERSDGTTSTREHRVWTQGGRLFIHNKIKEL